MPLVAALTGLFNAIIVPQSRKLLLQVSLQRECQTTSDARRSLFNDLRDVTKYLSTVLREWLWQTRPEALTARNLNKGHFRRHSPLFAVFEGVPTKIEKDGIRVYGRGVGGVMLDSRRDAVIRFDMELPGRHEFRCSIHPNMKGELLLFSVGAA